jgi:hypothetical protein
MKRTKRADQPKAESPPPEEPKPQTNGRPDVDIIQVTSLDQLQKVCEKLFHIEAIFPRDGGGASVMMIPIRLLRPSEAEQIELILKEAHPPMVEKVGPDGEKRMEYQTTPETIAKAAHLSKVARAIALWWCCPLFRDSEEGRQISASLKSDKPVTELSNRQIVFDFVQSKFTEKILINLYSIARTEEFSIEERTNFTTPPGSVQG